MRRIIGAFGVAVAIAFVFGVAVPNLTTARNRARQKLTMTDMRKIATALEARATRTRSYTMDPPAKWPDHGNSVGEFETLHRESFEDLERELVPLYIKTLPRKDGWGNDFDIRTGKFNEKGQATLYAVRSYGSDGRPDGGPYTSRAISDIAEDLVYSDGTFIQYPEGV